MYKTVWNIYYNGSTTELTYYHFGSAPKFPTWYMEAKTAYEIEMVWNLEIVFNFNTFMKCLTHTYIIKQDSSEIFSENLIQTSYV